MASSWQEKIVKEEYPEDFSHYSLQNLWTYELAVGDCQEDASTQTDAFTVCKSALPVQQMNVCETPISTLKVQELDPLCTRSSHCHKSKSPNTIKMLMEKHREKERLRHHCLNEQLHMICKIVPGFTEEGKETKVVMMQRIISYIAYLENSIQHLSAQLSIQPEESSSLLTNGVKDVISMKTYDSDCLPMTSEDSRDSNVSTLSISRRLKLSSPTIDSTTDCTSQEPLPLSSGSNNSVTTSQSDSSLVTDVKIEVLENDNQNNFKGSYMDWLTSEVFNAHDNFDSLYGGLAFDQDGFQPTSSPYEDALPEMESLDVDWLCSPKCLMKEKGENFGIKLDTNFLEEPLNEFSQADIVSPDQIMPHTSVKKEIADTNDLAHNVPCKKIEIFPEGSALEKASSDDDIKEDDCQVVPQYSERNLSTAKRAPLLDLVNVPDTFVGNTNEFSWAENEVKNRVDHDIPTASNFLEVESTMEEKDQWSENENLEEVLKRIRNKVLEEASKMSATSKLDLRRSSWMNGFMMFSRVYRRKFIQENPGVHTAQISKMMGQVWRDMTNEQQHLYREHAKLCSQDLQHIFDSKLIHSETHHFL